MAQRLFGAAVISTCLGQRAAAEKQGNTFHPVLSWEGPIEEQDFQNWDTALSSIPLKNKIVLLPNGKEHNGIIMGKWTFEATSWEMSIDLDIDYASNMAAYAKTQFQIYLLVQAPNFGKDHKAFVQELYDPSVHGFVIKTVSQSKPQRASSGGGSHSDPHEANHMIGINSVGDMKMLDHKAGQTFCNMKFKSAIYRIESDNERNTTLLEVKRDGEPGWQTCFEMPQSMDFTVHTYLAAGASAVGKERRHRAVYINSIKFYDNEPVIEGEQEQLDYFNEKEYREFGGTAHDLLHMGNVDGVLLKDEKKSRSSYNDKLLKYNSKYAQLVGKQKSNLEAIEDHFTHLPDVTLMDTIRRDIYELDQKQISFTNHFNELKSKILRVTNDFLNIRQSNGGDIQDESFSKDLKKVLMAMEREENSLQSLRRILTEDDKVSKEIRKSHLVLGASESESSPKDAGLLRRLKRDHLQALEDMVVGTSTKVSGSDIRGTDVPTEYVFVFAFFFIGTIGAFVFYQMKKASSSLPMAGAKRLD